MRNRLLVIAAVLLVVVLFVWQYPNIRDWWILRSYNPAPEIVAFKDSTTMTDEATRDFYLAKPELDSKQTFSQNCPVSELSLVLGCYSSSRIYILKVDQPELSKVMDVTAAHEMLHAAYADLSSRERERVDVLLEEYYRTSASPELKKLIAEYDVAQPGTRLNELHSLVGTQEKNIGPQLEEYYRQYFKDRMVVVSYYQSYESIFSGIQDNLLSLENSIVNLKDEITELEATIESEASELDQINRQLDVYEAAENISAYNALVPKQNSLVQSYNSNLTRYKSLIAQHNTKVEQYNQLGIRQNNLVNSLDATQFTPAPAS